MAKNSRRHQKAAITPRSLGEKAPPIASKRGKQVIAAGIVLVLLGFWVLTYVDPTGQNWAGTLSPALLVLGYGLIGIGIVLPQPRPTDSSHETPPA